MYMQLCKNCRYMYHSNTRVPCLCCDSNSLTIPCSGNLVDVTNKLFDLSLEVISSCCEIYYLQDSSGKTVQLTLELGSLYPDEMFYELPPEWSTYVYHSIIDNSIGLKCTGLTHSESFIPLDEDELEFATALTISNLELWLDNRDPDAFWSVWRLYGAI